ncbi:DUF4097 and DUF4098 domain-containing protein YvlB [Alkalihalobacillus xiaoxiensis]|uniref:DUF4097 and DUF4098 domain-containing protein YvlB n=1 Tax=Shouchella xiaoxiensis TaxID=766895 RepID=A0ABS2SY54_9BACI|nr:DUF4097 and DUF4098 domain-containing protein YvlB [Shouchella xiaoxiensis]
MEERKMILKMIEDGKISAEEGLKLLDSLGKDKQEPEQTDGHNRSDNESKSYKQTSADPEETPFSRFTSFFESAFQKVREGDLDFNFGSVTEVDHVFQHQGIIPKSVYVSLENGSVQVVPWEKEDIRLECEAKVYKAKDEEEARESLLKDSVFSATEEKVSFETKSKAMKVNVVLYVPEASYENVKLYAFNGSLNGESIKTDLFDASTTNGSIKTADLVAKKAMMETSNGSISCEGHSIGSLYAKTLNGSIKVDGAAEDADIETLNGTINYHVNDSVETGYLDIKTTTGSVKILVSDQIRFEGKLKSNVGSIRNRLSDAEIIDEKKEFAQRYMQVSANQAQSKRIKVHAVANTGTITVEDK